MKGKIKKLITATCLTAVSLTAIGCAQTNSNVAQNIDKSMADFVSSINSLDYVKTASAASLELVNESLETSGSGEKSKVGKIVETSLSEDVMSTSAAEAQSASTLILHEKYPIAYLNEVTYPQIIENTITRPEERCNNSKLFVLSSSPFIMISTGVNNNGPRKLYSTEKIEEASNEIDQKINTLILKRSILLIYVNEIYNGNVTLSEENKVAINAYVNVIKENTSFLNGNRGMVKNQLTLASDLASSNKNDELVGYYIIKSGEALETRASKLDSGIAAIDSIISIIESNLKENSAYYNSSLSTTYKNIVSNFNASKMSSEITKDSADKEVADSIIDSLRFKTRIRRHHHHHKHRKDKNEEKNKDIALLENSNNQNNVTIPENASKDTDKSVILNNSKVKNLIVKNEKSHNSNNNTQIKNNNDVSTTLENKAASANSEIEINVSENETQNEMTQQNANKRRQRKNRRKAGTKENLASQPKTLELKEETETTNGTKSNMAKSVVSMENEKIMRADRTPERQTTEKYSDTSNDTTNQINRARTVPFSTNN